MKLAATAFLQSTNSYHFHSIQRPYGLNLLKLWRASLEGVPVFQGGGRESPGMRVTFFRVVERKSPKKGRPYCLRPLRCATGQPGVLGHGVRRRTHCALTRSVQTTAASQFTKHGRSDAHAHPAPCAPQAHTEGNPRIGHPFGPSLHSAQPAQREALAPARWGRAQQRPVRLLGCSAVGCLTAQPPAGCACGGAVAG